MSSLWHLAIESSGLGGSIALFRHDSEYQGVLHAQEILPPNKGSVQTLAPAIQNVLNQSHMKAKDLGSLSVTCGPGSFTGLRVGLATAKMLGWAAQIPIVPVDTLQAIALRFAHSGLAANGQTYRVVAAINAFRRQVFTSSWSVEPSDESKPVLTPIERSKVLDADQWLSDPWQHSHPSQSTDDDSELWITGGALATYSSIAISKYQLAPSELWQPLAEQVGSIGLVALAEGRTVTAQELSPNYIRASAAEEKRV